MLASIVLAIGCVAYGVTNRPRLKWNVNLVPLFIIIGYCTITLSSSNRDLRYSFLGIIALPFVVGILMSRGARALPHSSAAVAAIAVFGYLAAVGFSTLHRADRRSIARSELVMAQAANSKAKTILLATDGRTLNWDLLLVASELSPLQGKVETNTLANNAANDQPIAQDFQQIRESDLVVFEDMSTRYPAWANQRAPEYEAYAQKIFGKPVKVVGDIRIYVKPALLKASESTQAAE